MPGSWELLQDRQVLVGILHVESTCMAWSLGFRNLIIPGRVEPLAGMPFDHARNVLCQIALRDGYKHIFFLDSDVVPPRDAILRLIAHNKPVISGVYHRRSPPVGVPVMQRGGQWVLRYPANAIIEVDVVGAGCLLIQRQLLERLPPIRPGHHWFDWRVNYNGLPGQTRPGMSEDFEFCRQCRDNGVPVLVDTSIQCRHLGMGEATYGKWDACNTTAVT